MSQSSRDEFERRMREHHQVVVSEPVSFIAGNGPMIVRPHGMTDKDWQEIVRRETEARRS